VELSLAVVAVVMSEEPELVLLSASRAARYLWPPCWCVLRPKCF